MLRAVFGRVGHGLDIFHQAAELGGLRIDDYLIVGLLLLEKLHGGAVLEAKDDGRLEQNDIAAARGELDAELEVLEIGLLIIDVAELEGRVARDVGLGNDREAARTVAVVGDAVTDFFRRDRRLLQGGELAPETVDPLGKIFQDRCCVLLHNCLSLQ